MCARYYIDRLEGEADLKEIIAALNRTGQEGAKLEGEIFPGDRCPALSRSLKGEKRPFLMRWGFSTPKGLVINARTESAAVRPLFRDSLGARRCILPASGYFEWGPPLREKKKTRYYIRNADGDPLMLLAGLYRKEKDGAQFVILTREAGEDTAPIHPRMPLILPRDRAEEWLFSDGEGERVLRSFLEKRRPLSPAPFTEGDREEGEQVSFSQLPSVDQVASAYQ